MKKFPAHLTLELFAGKNPAMQSLIETLRRVASTDLPVLIQGESGTGKEMCALWLHQFAQRGHTPMVKVSCPAIPHALLESELFGHEKGAFTGAVAGRKGRVEAAENGTLFLDEIGHLHPSMQSKLLRFLQDGTFYRLGGQEPHHVRTRLVCTANRDLRQGVQEGSFRLDLLHRINTVSLTMPPLRDRAEDIPGLIDFFLEKYSVESGTTPQPIPRDILRSLYRYAWPGNIRQLENMIRTYVLIGNPDALVPETHETEMPGKNPLDEIDLSQPASLKDITRRMTQQVERHIILKVLKSNGWNRRATAKWLGISYRSLLYKLEEFDAMAQPEPPPQPSEQPPASLFMRQDT